MRSVDNETLLHVSEDLGEVDDSALHGRSYGGWLGVCAGDDVKKSTATLALNKGRVP